MRNSKAKKIRKSIGYDLRKERETGREYFTLQSKTEKDQAGNPKYLGIVCSEQRRFYQYLKHFTS